MDAEKVPYSYLSNELMREVEEEVGMVISVDPMWLHCMQYFLKDHKDMI